MSKWKAVREVFQEFLKRKIGLLGFIMLVIFVVIAVMAPVLAPINPSDYRSPTAWVEYPKGVPPEWVALFSSKKPAKHLILKNYELSRSRFSGFTNTTLKYKFRYDSDTPPKNIVIAMNVSNVTQAFIRFRLVRPDNKSLTLKTMSITSGSLNQSQAIKLSLFEDSSFLEGVVTWLAEQGVNVKKGTTNLGDYIFLNLNNGKVLKGDYELRVMVISTYDIKFDKAEIILSGAVYGLMGTDAFGRDLFYGLVWGTPIALLIGVLVSVLSTMIGLFYGVVAGYIGGYIDEVLMRIVDILLAMPVLPILIVMSLVFKPSWWEIALMITIFGWEGLSRVVRSIALQLRESAFVEAARSIGASRWRIIIKHIVPNIIPYTVASLALAVPGAILTEASLSFLGLGDPTFPTWGTILHDAEMGGALSSGMWWWFIPPGLLIALVSMSFVFMGYAIDEIVNPRLRRR